MNVQLVKTGDRQWLHEDGAPTWGLGIQVQEVAERRFRNDDYETEHYGWLIEFMVGPWLLAIFTREAWKGWHGPGYHPQPFFEYVSL